jgi:hypothetical protein
MNVTKWAMAVFLGVALAAVAWWALIGRQSVESGGRRPEGPRAESGGPGPEVRGREIGEAGGADKDGNEEEVGEAGGETADEEENGVEAAAAGRREG